MSISEDTLMIKEKAVRSLALAVIAVLASGLTFCGEQERPAVVLRACGDPEGGWMPNTNYVLGENIVADLQRNDVCLEPDDSPVFIDGNGHSLRHRGDINRESRGTAIRLNETNGVQITNLTIIDFRIGVRIRESSDSRITETTFDNNGHAVQIWGSSGTAVEGNSFVGLEPPAISGIGIELQVANQNRLIDNDFRGLDVPILLSINNSGNRIQENTIEASDYGIRVFVGTGNALMDNTIRNNRRGGIYLQDVVDTDVRDNSISGIVGDVERRDPAAITWRRAAMFTYGIM